MGSPNAVLRLLAVMGDVPDRQANAQHLASHLGAQQLLLFVLDPVVGALLPARGMPATLDGGPLWRQFMLRCRADGSHAALVDWPRGTLRNAVAIMGSKLAVVLLGGTPREPELATLRELLPLLASAVVTQQRIEFMQLEVREAKAAASRAHSLAQALDAARAAGEHLNAELRDKDQRKDEFLAMLAHELRNPLSALTTSVEILKRSDIPAGPTRETRSLEVMTRQLRHLTRLVGDLLDVSRVSRGMIELQLEQFDLRNLLLQVHEESRPSFEAGQLELRVALGQEALVVMGDRVRLAQVFGNLLHNAGKYSDPGGRIDLRGAREGSQVVVSVRDTGMGLPTDMHDKVFDLFTQVRVGLDRSQGGLGIGLTLVRSLVQLHGGTVRAESEGLGLGAAFTVVLPCSAQAAEPVVPVASKPPSLDDLQSAISARRQSS